MKILQVNSGMFGDGSQSTQLATAFVRQLKQVHPESVVTVRDLVADPLPHLDATNVQAFATPPDQRTPAQQALVDRSDRLINELREADHVVIGLPMYNFSVPSVMKAWFDQLARAGVTFRYTANGPEGLLADKPVTVLAARGGQYAGTPADWQTGFVKQFFGFLGLRQVEFIYAERLNMGDEARQSALSAARAEMADRVEVA